MAHPYTTAAGLFIADLADCLAAAGAYVPSNVGVVWCADCIIPGCCDHLVGLLRPDLQRGCVADEWELPVTYGICYSPTCGEGPKPDVWLPTQQDLAGRLEDALNALVDCSACEGCNEAVSVEPFCSGGCAGFRLTYRLRPYP